MRKSRRSTHNLRAVLAVAYTLVGLVAAWTAVLVARGLGVTRQGQQVIAFVCIAGALLALSLNASARPDDPASFVATMVALGVAGVAALTIIGPIQRDAGLGCIVSDGPIKATISADEAIIFARATPDSDSKGLLLRGCNVGFVGYCIGAVHPDVLQFGLNDSRWMKLSDGQGLVPSGQTVGTTPASLRPSSCPGGVKPPNALAFKGAIVDVVRGRLSLLAQAPRAALIGFAAELPDGRWRRVSSPAGPER